MNIFIGFAVVLFVVVSLGVNSNVLPSNIVSAYGIIIETPFEDNLQHNNNKSSDNDVLVFDYLSSLYAKEQKEKKEDKMKGEKEFLYRFMTTLLLSQLALGLSERQFFQYCYYFLRFLLNFLSQFLYLP